jgi:hypothetical protein
VRNADPRWRRSVGAALIGCGTVFLVLGITGDRTAFLAVGPALATVGIVLVARANRS